MYEKIKTDNSKFKTVSSIIKLKVAQQQFKKRNKNKSQIFPETQSERDYKKKRCVPIFCIIEDTQRTACDCIS